MMKSVVLALLLCYLPRAARARSQPNPQAWKQCTTISCVYRLYPDRIHNLFNKLDLEYPGLEGVQAAVRAENYKKACRLLLGYYKSKSKDYFQNSSNQKFNLQTAQYAVNDTFVITGTKARVPRDNDGGLDWRWIPEDYYNNQWHQITRHHWWMDLLYAYKTTGNKKYAQYLDMEIRDWTLHEKKFKVFKLDGPFDWVKRGGPARLDAGIRMNNWPQVFYSFYHSKYFSDATKLLMLNSLYRHGDYIEDTWKKDNNHVIMEMNGLANIAVSFQEFTASDYWLDLAYRKFKHEFNQQILPDGVQYELAHGYHQVVVRHYLDFRRLLHHAGHTFGKELNNKLEKAINYSEYVVNPKHQLMANNDSEQRDMQDWLLTQADNYSREDWLYIATNGKKGSKPKELPSVMFPWAGQLISRSGWGRNAQWSFFDVGPYGENHQHHDKLNIVTYAYGRKLLVDNGKYTYKHDKWRTYFQGAQAHNVILVNNQSQKAYEKRFNTPFTQYKITQKADFARASFNAGWENGIEGKHTRAMIYVRGKYWVVFDRVDVGNNSIQALWHFNYKAMVKKSGQRVKTMDKGKGNLMIIPLSNFSWNIKLKKGETYPIQGWESIDHIKHPAYCAEYSTDVSGSTSFAWILYPKDGQVKGQPVKARIIKKTKNYIDVEIEEKGKDNIEIIARLSDTKNPIQIRKGITLQKNFKLIN